MEFTFYSRYTSMLAQKGAEETADYAVRMGFSSVEVLEVTSPGHPSAIPDRETAKKVREILASRGLRTACYSVGTNLWQAGSGENPAEESLKKQAEIAAELGSPFLHHTLLPWLRRTEDAPEKSEAIEQVTETAARIARYAAPLGVACLYEDQGLYCNGIDGFGLFYREVKNRAGNVGVCGDVGNILFVDEEPVPFFKAFAGEIRHVHIKDYLKKNVPESPGMYWLPTGKGWVRDTMVGSGVIDFEGCLNVLKEAGYDGALAFELEHPEPFDEGVRQGMAYLKRFL